MVGAGKGREWKEGERKGGKGKEGGWTGPSPVKSWIRACINKYGAQLNLSDGRGKTAAKNSTS